MRSGFALIAVILFLVFADAQARAAVPNIVLIMSDDLGYGDLACYGAPDVKTPHLDRLARQGARFTQFYANGPECSPTRTALLTGQYQQRAGGLECAIGTGNVGRYDDAIRLAERGELGLPRRAAVLPSALKAAGYATAVFGKWHLGYESKHNPLNYGFDRFFGCLGGNVDYFTHKELSPLKVLYQDRRPVQRQGYMTHLITEESLEFIRRNSKKPFFLFASYTTPHFPFQAPGDKDKEFNKDNWTTGTRETYAHMVEDLDAQVGRILQLLDDAEMADNTLVVFVSDNGAMRPGRNLPFSNYKSTVFEGGIRVPLLVRFPSRVEPGALCRQTAITMDLTRSFLRLAGAKYSPEQLDGIDIIDHLEKRRPDFNRTLFWRGRRGGRTERAARDGNLKYIHRRLEDGTEHECLFDLTGDPSEKKNVINKRPESAARLRNRLKQWEQEVRPER